MNKKQNRDLMFFKDTNSNKKTISCFNNIFKYFRNFVSNFYNIKYY